MALRRGRLTEALSFARRAGVDRPLTIIEARIRLAMGESPDQIARALLQPAPGPNRGSRGGDRAWHDVQGFLALKRGAGADAIEHFRAAIKDRPTAADPETLEDCLANAYVELGRFDEAIAEYERILKINSRYPLAHYGLGLAFEGKRQPAKARGSFEQFLALWEKADRDIPQVIKARQHLVALQ